MQIISSTKGEVLLNARERQAILHGTRSETLVASKHNLVGVSVSTPIPEVCNASV